MARDAEPEKKFPATPPPAGEGMGASRPAVGPFSLDTNRNNGASQVDALEMPSVEVPTRLGETLADVSSTGRRRPWAEQKRTSRAIAASLIRIGKADGDGSYERAGSRVWTCASDLTFRVEADPETGEVVQHLDGAHFCRDRLCPVCQWRKSLLTGASLSRCLAWVDEKHPGTAPIFLTVTMRNVAGDELGDAIGTLTDGWRRMVRDHGMKERIRGFFRSVEVTYAAGSDTWHPHIHAILLVDESYFTDPALYMTQAAWVEAWRRFARLDYKPIVDVRALASERGRRAAVAEAAKYSVKPGEWVSEDPDETDAHVRVLREALRGRRLTTWGGLLKEARAALKIADAEDADADLLHTGDEEEGEGPALVPVATVRYAWSDGWHDYVCVAMEAEPGMVVLARGDPGGGRRARAA